MRRIALTIAPAVCFAVLLGCSDGSEPAPPGTGPASPAGEPLPAPASAAGGVTGMPDQPGPGASATIGQPAPAAIEPLRPGDATSLLPPLEDNPETGLAQAGTDTGVIFPDTAAEAVAGRREDAAATPPMEAEAATAVLRDYYAALDARDYARAYALWSDGGRSSGQTPEQFASAFAGAARISVSVGAPGPVEGAAGSRYVEIPVSVTTRDAGGAVTRQVGAYTLRRAVVDGASAQQRSWRIASAQLRELQP
ncbi:hypothetical protein QFW77_13720 [Luteimonas sp. RD2P54]|uniref:Lipoprotein n=1 Tax=Luteimonas endophytica TaxID=3042023 RepID=A0ABT6JB40_9GAMM|nr:hypothetical protein [Luteimonas endophytica]MDH5824036.1 hypothetical protein [Luteimonas endophytica]